MLWRRKKDDRPKNSVAPTETTEADKALDTVAHILRAYGQFAFDTDSFDADDLRQRCDEWASRILVGSPREAQPDNEETDSAPRSISRDFTGVRRFLREHREVEAEYVGRSIGNLRQAIQTFASCLTSAVNQDRSADQGLENHVHKLSVALSQKDTTFVRECAVHLVDAVRQSIQSRRQREQQQLKSLAEKLSSLRGQLTEAKVQAATDALTGLSNRAAFDTHLERLSDLGLLFPNPPCLLMIDLDFFKEVNDRYGHPAGDHALVETANCLTRTFLRKQDFVARYGGEEFAVLLVDTHYKQAEILANRACDTVRSRSIAYDGNDLELTISVGVAPLHPGEGKEAWLKRADSALYLAKTQGRDRVVVDAKDLDPPSPPTSRRAESQRRPDRHV